MVKVSRRQTLAFGSALATGPAWALRAADPAKPPRVNTGRPQTDFIYSQVAAGRVLGPENSKPGVATGILAYDRGSGAITVMFRYPPGWHVERVHYNDSDEEILVLEGDLSVNEMKFQSGTYAYLPAGLVRKSMRSEKGATVLTCYEGEHLNFYADPPAGLYDESRLNKGMRTDRGTWHKAAGVLAPSWHQGRQMVLREDPKSGDRTWLLKAGPDDLKKIGKRPVATHSAIQEIYVLDGEISTPHGVMRSGAFAWILPGKSLGPLGTRTGFTAWCRSKGGAQTTTFSQTDSDIVWDAAYAPDISEDMKSFAFKTFPETQRY